MITPLSERVLYAVVAALAAHTPPLLIGKLRTYLVLVCGAVKKVNICSRHISIIVNIFLDI